MTTSSTAHPRQPKGQPTGGQFAAKSNPEADIELEPSWPGFTREVWHGKQPSTVQWLDADGKLQDPPDGSPAVRDLRPDGSVEYEAHWQAGKLQDPPDGSPAIRWSHPDGTVEREEHYQADKLQDPPDGSPALRRLRPDGTVEYEEYYQADKLQDPPDGSPAVRWFRSDGLVANEAHYQSGRLQDPPDGSPAIRRLRSDGTVEYESHYQAGKRQGGAPQAAIAPDQQLYNFLGGVRSRLDSGERPTEIVGPFGTHGVRYDEEDGEEYATVGFALPDGVFAEIDGDAYGEMVGFRIYLGEAAAEPGPAIAEPDGKP